MLEKALPRPEPKAFVRQEIKHRIFSSAARPSAGFLGPVTFTVSKGTMSGVSGELRFGSA